MYVQSLVFVISFGHLPSAHKMKKQLKVTGALTVVYILSYLIFRDTSIETWNKDGNQYVIFPEGQTWIYYLYRPLTYIDSKLTTMKFHIGPHK